jgi:hypothetical protein
LTPRQRVWQPISSNHNSKFFIFSVLIVWYEHLICSSTLWYTELVM